MIRTWLHPGLLGPMLAIMAATGCGYHVAGQAAGKAVGQNSALPAHIRSIAIPPFANASLQYRIADQVTSAVVREFIQRTRYRITSDPAQADAVLYGSMVNFISYPTTFDPNTGRASGVQVIVNLQISLRERETGKILFNRPNFEIRERYEISVDPKTYFDESSGAQQRLSRDVAQSVVSAILENF